MFLKLSKFPLRRQQLVWWVSFICNLWFFSCSLQYSFFVLYTYCFTYDMPWEFFFSLGCFVLYVPLVSVRIYLSKIRKFFSRILLKICSIPLTCDSSTSCMPLIWWFVLFMVSYISYMFLSCAFYNFSYCLFTWSRSCTLSPDSLSSAWCIQAESFKAFFAFSSYVIGFFNFSLSPRQCLHLFIEFFSQVLDCLHHVHQPHVCSPSALSPWFYCDVSLPRL